MFTDARIPVSTVFENLESRASIEEITVGARAFQHDLIEIAGGQNLFGDADRETFQPTLEEVISRKPDIIIETLAPPLGSSEIAQRQED